MLIAGVSTLIFNGNPLLRYDAYYVLSDLLEMPNLAGRALRCWRGVLERVLFGVRGAVPEGTAVETALLLAYGAASTIYRLVVTCFIALFIAGRFFFVGVLLAIWAVAAMVVLPVVRLLGYVTTGPSLHGHRTRAVTVGLGGLALLAGAALFLPIPDHTYAQGVAWLSDQSLVRAEETGFLRGFPTAPGTAVPAGAPLVALAAPDLAAKVAESEARVAELDAALGAEAIGDPVKADIARDQLASERANLAELRSRVATLVVRAKQQGVFVVPAPGDMPGRYYKKGELLGWVLGPQSRTVRVVVPQDAVDRVRMDADRVSIRLLDGTHRVIPGRIVRAVPGGDEYLPSRALATDAGGDIPTDPRDTKGPKTLQRTFQFDVELQGAAFTQFGQRVMVRFEHPPAPLATQILRSLRLLFLSRFSV
jgi:putative peptide zinc metalloprotease protein